MFYKMTAMLLLGAATAAVAQTEGNTPPRGAVTGLQDIVVTAQRRAENLQDVPVAVTAFTADVLAERRIVSANDLSGLSPSLHIYQQAVQSNPGIIIRGVAGGSSNNGIDPKVGVYLDGVYIGRTVGSLFDLPDIERIEVLRGPQGTLFGRNATSGAINITSGTPTGDWGFRGSASIGNQRQRRYKGVVNFPALGRLSLRVAYLHDEIDGYVKNLIGGETLDLTARANHYGTMRYADKLGARNTDAVQAAVRLDLDNLKVDYHFDWTNTKAVAFPMQSFGILSDASGALSGAVVGLQPYWGGISNLSTGPLSEIASATTLENLTTQGHSLTLTLQASDQLTVKSITAFRKYTQDPNIDDIAASGGLRLTTAQLFGLIDPSLDPAARQAIIFDPANIPGPRDQFFTLLTARDSRQKQFTQELQLQYSGTKFDLTAGAFYFSENSPALDVLALFEPIQNGVDVPNPVIDSIFGGGNTSTRAINKSLAAYGQATYHLSDTIDLTGGLRYTMDDRRSEIYSTSAGGGAILGVGVYKADYNKLTYTGILTWQPNRDITSYAKVSSGYVAGGIVSGVPFRPETLTSYELGFKSQLLDNRLRANLAVYYAKYKDLQSQNFTDGKQSFNNAGRATIKGVEAELTAMPVNGLVLGGMLSYTDFDYQQFIVGGVDIAKVAIPPYFSAWQWSASAQYDAPAFANGSHLFARAEVNYTGRSAIVLAPLYDTAGNLDPIDGRRWVKPYALLDARAGLVDLNIGGADASLTLFGKNLTNKRYISFGASAVQLVGSFARGRTYGVELGIKFR